MGKVYQVKLRLFLDANYDFPKFILYGSCDYLVIEIPLFLKSLLIAFNVSIFSELDEEEAIPCLDHDFLLFQSCFRRSLLHQLDLEDISDLIELYLFDHV